MRNRTTILLLGIILITHSAKAGELSLRILHADDRPAVGAAAVLVTDDETILGHGITDASGMTTLPPSVPGSSIIVLGATHPSHREEARLDRTLQEILLPAGSTIEGKVRVEGSRPEEPVLLLLQPSEQNHRPEPFSHSQLNAISQYLFDHARDEFRGQTTGPDGTFLFGGLEEGWEGTLEVSPLYRLENRDYSVPVRAPQAKMDVQLRKKPTLRGRIVESTGSPSAFASGWYDFKGSAGRVVSDEKGRFWISIGGHTIHEGSIAFSTRNQQERAIVSLGKIDTKSGADLGDIVLSRGRDISFVVLDRSGRPVPGAIAWTEDETQVISLPTDDEGHGLLASIMDTTKKVRVAAFCRPSIELAIPDEIDGPILATLPLGFGVDLRLVTENGAPASSFTVELRAPEDPFVEEIGFFSPLRQYFQLPMPTTRQSGPDKVTCRFQPDPEGRFSFVRLKPGLPIKFHAITPRGLPSGAVLEFKATEPGFPTAEIRVSTRSRSLVGKILDGNSRPIEGAKVVIAAPGAPYFDPRENRMTRSDSRGNFAVQDIFAASIAVRISKEGFASAYLDPLDLASSKRPVEFVLSPGKPLTVSLLNSNGDLVDALSMEILEEGRQIRRGQWREKGIFDFTDLPDRPLMLLAKVGGREFREKVVPGTHALQLPPSGSLAVEWMGAREARDFGVLKIHSKAPGTHDLWIHLALDQTTHGGTLVAPIVFPGTYSVWVETEDSDGNLVLLSKRVKVIVQPGKTATPKIGG